CTSICPPTRALDLDIDLFVTERAWASGSHFLLTVVADRPTFTSSVRVSPPTLEGYLPQTIEGGWQFEFNTYEELGEFVTGLWDVRHASYVSGTRVEQIFRFDVDSALPEGARVAAVIDAPQPGETLRQGEWMNVAWTFPEGAPAGTPV